MDQAYQRPAYEPTPPRFREAVGLYPGHVFPERVIRRGALGILDRLLHAADHAPAPVRCECGSLTDGRHLYCSAECADASTD